MAPTAVAQLGRRRGRRGDVLSAGVADTRVLAKHVTTRGTYWESWEEDSQALDAGGPRDETSGCARRGQVGPWRVGRGGR